MKRTSGKIKITPTNRKSFSVYLLYDGDEVIYVGKTIKRPENRIEHHSEKVFDGYKIIECRSKQEMNQLESELIFNHIPKYNKILHSVHTPNIVCVGNIKGYEIDKKMGDEGIVLKGRVYVKIK